MKRLLLALLFALSSSSLFAARPEPQAQIDAFFATLGEKGAAAAIDGLCKGTFLEAQKGPQITALTPQFDAALKIYGKITRIEKVDTKPYGESFVRHRLISYHANGAPLFWDFMFYRAQGEWQVYVFRFNDQFDKVFAY